MSSLQAVHPRRTTSRRTNAAAGVVSTPPDRCRGTRWSALRKVTPDVGASIAVPNAVVKTSPVSCQRSPGVEICARPCGSRCCGSGGGLDELLDRPAGLAFQPAADREGGEHDGGVGFDRVALSRSIGRARRSDLDIGSSVRSARAGGSRRARTPVWRLAQRIQYCDDPKSLRRRTGHAPTFPRFLPRH